MTRLLMLAALTAGAAAAAENYCWGFLNAHPERKPIPDAEAQEIQKAHLAHLERMGQEGKLLAAGPMAIRGGPIGIVVYRCSSIAEAEAWAAADPAVQKKRLSVEMYRWVGPDGVGEPLMTQLKTDPKAKFEMVRLPLVIYRRTDKWKDEPPGALAKSHREYVESLERTGKVRMRGRLSLDPGQSSAVAQPLGLAVLSAMTLEEATALVAQDPLVREGYVRTDNLMWFVANEVIPPAAK
ncbi:MAG: YciI family protein [Bryobacteraceae bacterium]|nr:YciI family protein [Bryobacteraceae bacterium]